MRIASSDETNDVLKELFCIATHDLGAEWTKRLMLIVEEAVKNGDKPIDHATLQAISDSIVADMSGRRQ